MPLDVYVLVEAIWLILPAYAANGLIPIFRGKHPIDFNKKFFDRQPILGKGKSWEGLVFACIIGIVIALIQAFAYPFLPWDLSPIQLTIVPMTATLGFLLGFGAVIGDMVGSFIKRRLKLQRGRPAPLLDQEDFLLGALLFASFIIAIKIEWVIILLILTPIIHFVASFVGYKIRLKREPY